MKGGKRKAAEYEWELEQIYGVYQVISKNPGNDFESEDFWQRCKNQDQLPESIKALDLYKLTQLWKFIVSKMEGKIYKFKSIMSDYDRTYSDKTDFHKKITEALNKTFFDHKKGNSTKTSSKEFKVPPSPIKAPKKKEEKRDVIQKITRSEIDYDIKCHINKKFGFIDLDVLYQNLEYLRHVPELANMFDEYLLHSVKDEDFQNHPFIKVFTGVKTLNQQYIDAIKLKSGLADPFSGLSSNP